VCGGGSPPACSPEEGICCTCVYRNTTTGALVSTCIPGVPGDDSSACDAPCRESAPLGTALAEEGISVAFSAAGSTLVCEPTTGEQPPGDRCAFVPCTCVPSGATATCAGNHECCSGRCESGICCGGTCTTDDDCCGDATCDIVVGECVAPSPPPP
jgi:hypothetical protein